MDFRRLSSKGKTNINVTIDVELLEEINKFKKEHDIKQLSPLINDMLWQWITELREGAKDED